MCQWAQCCVDRSILLLKVCRALMNILLRTGSTLETYFLNEWFWSAADLLYVSLVSCFCGVVPSGITCK